MSKKIWFAKKQDGEIIALSELEALTHFEQNNISTRMRLVFIGTSDGKEYDRIINEAKALPAEERPAKVKEAFEAELAIAKANGVEEPDRTLRIITRSGGEKATGLERKKIIKSMMN